MEIRIRDTGAVMLEQEFRAMFPNTGFPTQLTEAIINEFGGDVVFEGPQAQPTRYQVGFRDGVEQIDGKWYTKYSVTDMDQEAKDVLDARQAASQRAERNRRLAETDWRFRSDMNPSQEWIDYCQALRDVTAQAGFPWDIEWPVKPE
jgi:hypothetical protein